MANKGSVMNVGNCLLSGDYISNGRCHMIMQPDGNLAIYLGADPDHRGPRCWQSGTANKGSSYALMQSDGNFVVYQGTPASQSGATWHSHTWTIRQDQNLAADVPLSAELSAAGQLGLYYQRAGEAQKTAYYSSGGNIAMSANSLLMTERIAGVRDRKLVDIVFAGTHDSGAYEKVIDEFDPSQPDFLKGMQLFSVVIAFVVEWGRAQSMNLCEQLRFGIRYFDMRVMRSEWTKDLHVFHGFVGHTLKDVLADVRRYLDSVPASNEVIFMSFSHFSRFESTDPLKLYTLIDEGLGRYRCKNPSGLLERKVGELTASGPCVVVCFDNSGGDRATWDALPADKQAEFLIEGDLVRGIGLDGITVAQYAEKLDQRMAECRAEQTGTSSEGRKLYKLSWTLTPDDELIKSRPLDNLAKVAESINNALYTMHGSMSLHRTRVNCLMFDFPEKLSFLDSSLPDYIVNLNNQGWNAYPVRQYALQATVNNKYVGEKADTNLIQDIINLFGLSWTTTVVVTNQEQLAGALMVRQVGNDPRCILELADHRLLTSFEAEWRLTLTEAGKSLDRATYTVEHAGDAVGFRSQFNGRYICADEYGTESMVVNRTQLGDWEKFRRIPSWAYRADDTGVVIALQSVLNGEFLMCHPTAGLMTSKAPNPDTSFLIDHPTGGTYNFKTTGERYLIAQGGGNNSLDPSSTNPSGAWEQFSFAWCSIGQAALRAQNGTSFVRMIQGNDRHSADCRGSNQYDAACVFAPRALNLRALHYALDQGLLFSALVTLQSVETGQFIRSDAACTVWVNGTQPGSDPAAVQELQGDLFVLLVLDRNRCGLKARNGQFLCAEGGGGAEVNANRSAAGSWETFFIDWNSNGILSLRTADGHSRLVRSGNNRLLAVDKDQYDPAVSFGMTVVR